MTRTIRCVPAGAQIVVLTAIAFSGIAEAKSSNPMGAVALAGALGLVGLGLAIFGFIVSARAKRALAWPTTEGRMVSSEITSKINRSFRNGRPRNVSTTYYLKVRYTYRAGVQDFESDNFRVGYDDVRPGEISALQAKYAKGNTVTVHYNPDKPSESVLEVKDRALIFKIIGGAIALLGFGGAIAITLATRGT